MRTRTDIRHLQAFVEVCVHRHFTRAANALNMSQPALSLLIAQLEEDLGTPLLNRTTRSVEITPAGKHFLSSASRIVGDLHRSVGEMKDYSQLRRGSLKIAALPSLCSVLLPEAVRMFTAIHDGIAVRIIDVPGDEVVDQVVRREADLGIGYVHSPELVVAEPIVTDRLVAVAAPDILPEGLPLTWSRLAEHRLIAMAKGTTIRRLIEESWREANVTPNVALEPNQMATAIAYARSRLGVAILPSSGVPQDVGGICQIEIVSPVVERTLSVVSPKGIPLPPPAAAFLELLRKRFASETGSPRS